MSVKLNHTIVAARDNKASALFLRDILGIDEAPLLLGPFAVVTVGDQLTLDFLTVDGEVHAQHYAFLVSESEFDAIFARIKVRGLAYWADPYRRQPGEINHWDDGRGSTSTTPAAISWRSSRGPTAARVPRPSIRIRWWRNSSWPRMAQRHDSNPSVQTQSRSGTKIDKSLHTRIWREPTSAWRLSNPPRRTK